MGRILITWTNSQKKEKENKKKEQLCTTHNN